MLKPNLETHIFYTPDKNLLEREASRINNFLALESNKYELPCEKEGPNLLWDVKAEVISEEETPFSYPGPACLALTRKSSFPWREYVGKGWQEIWETRSSFEQSINKEKAKHFLNGKFTMSRNMALILPEKLLALDLRDPLFIKNKNLKKILRGAGYRVLKDPHLPRLDSKEYKESLPYLHSGCIHEETFHPSIIQNMDYEVHELMRKRKSIKPFDRRMYEIIAHVTKGIVDFSSISLRDLTYQFITYDLKMKKIGQDYMNQEEEIAIGKMRVFNVPASDAVEGKLEKILGRVSPSCAIGLRSIVFAAGEKKQIPQIDFYEGILLPKKGKEELEHGIKKIFNYPGLLVNSGKSAHYYGFKLLNDEEWNTFIHQLETFPLADQGFVKIQFESGSTLLRLTPCHVKMYQPCVYKMIE